MVKWFLLLWLWVPAGAELASIDDPPVLGTEHWVRRLRDLPELGPGEHVYALLWARRGASGDDTRQLVVEVRAGQATLTVYRLGGQVLQQRTLSSEERAGFEAAVAHAPPDYEADDADPDAYAYVHWWDQKGEEVAIPAGDPFLENFRGLVH